MLCVMPGPISACPSGTALPPGQLEHYRNNRRAAHRCAWKSAFRLPASLLLPYHTPPTPHLIAKPYAFCSFSACRAPRTERCTRAQTCLTWRVPDRTLTHYCACCLPPYLNVSSGSLFCGFRFFCSFFPVSVLLDLFLIWFRPVVGCRFTSQCHAACPRHPTRCLLLPKCTFLRFYKRLGLCGTLLAAFTRLATLGKTFEKQTFCFDFLLFTCTAHKHLPLCLQPCFARRHYHRHTYILGGGRTNKNKCHHG